MMREELAEKVRAYTNQQLGIVVNGQIPKIPITSEDVAGQQIAVFDRMLGTMELPEHNEDLFYEIAELFCRDCPSVDACTSSELALCDNTEAIKEVIAKIVLAQQDLLKAIKKELGVKE